MEPADKKALAQQLLALPSLKAMVDSTKNGQGGRKKPTQAMVVSFDNGNLTTELLKASITQEQLVEAGFLANDPARGDGTALDLNEVIAAAKATIVPSGKAAVAYAIINAISDHLEPLDNVGTLAAAEIPLNDQIINDLRRAGVTRNKMEEHGFLNGNAIRVIAILDAAAGYKPPAQAKAL